ncbi:MAG: transposase [Deltaproteobacteria bacterium]|nr:transposase [Deltaproteobacteria bacterium]
MTSDAAPENLARYIIRASFYQERMPYFPEESKVIYQSRDEKDEKVFDTLEGFASMCSHVPNKGEQMVRYYGYYSPAVPRGPGASGKKGSAMNGTLDSGTRFIQRLQKKLGKAGPEKL